MYLEVCFTLLKLGALKMAPCQQVIKSHVARNIVLTDGRVNGAAVEHSIPERPYFRAEVRQAPFIKHVQMFLILHQTVRRLSSPLLRVRRQHWVVAKFEDHIERFVPAIDKENTLRENNSPFAKSTIRYQGIFSQKIQKLQMT